jgi:hypothetical protein
VVAMHRGVAVLGVWWSGGTRLLTISAKRPNDQTTRPPATPPKSASPAFHRAPVILYDARRTDTPQPRENSL